MSRRRALLWGGGALAGLVGAAVGWQRYALGPVLEPAERAFWQQNWPDLMGQPVALGQWRGQPLLVNFWATWCPPCVEELPLLDAAYAKANGHWPMLAVAIDRASSVTSFLQRQPLRIPVVVAALGGTDTARDLGNRAGGLPFSVQFDAQGRVAHRKLGKLDEADLQRWNPSA
jgi:thiol-disulfide isomerase/thioredoxin